MRKSPTIRPSRPSTGTTPIQRMWPGKSARNAGTNITSHTPPKDFAIGDDTLRERNQRIPSSRGNTARRKAPIPKPWSRTSERYAPTTPIQLRAAREPVRTDALLSDGSSGEYDAKARNRRSAETHKKKPISSLSRRLFVGANIRENFMGRIACRDRNPDV